MFQVPSEIELVTDVMFITLRSAHDLLSYLNNGFF